MGEPARGMERTSTFAGMWRAEARRRGGCCESRAMDRRGQASAAVNCSRWRSGDRAENGCAMVPVGSGAREGLTHGVPCSGRTVAGCGHRSWGGSGEWAGGGSGRVGGGQVKSRGKRSRPGGSGMQSAQCYRQWRKVRRGGGLAGVARVGGVAGCGVRSVVVSVRADRGGWGVLLAMAGVRGCSLACSVRCGVSGVWVGGARQTPVQSWAPSVWWRAVAGGCVLLPGLLLRGSGEDVERELHGN